MVVWLEIETWVIGKGGTKGGGQKGVSGWEKRYGGCWILWPLCVLGCISAVVVEDACVRDCKGLGVCIVGTVS
jgi:hypothetical protein